MEEVRRWRREAYEERQRKSPEENARYFDELAAKLGLRVVPPEELAKSREQARRKSA